jgi:fatty-acyl-CoA synthase
LQAQLPGVSHFIILTDVAHMPVTSLRNVLCYEELLAAEEPVYAWPELDENAACALCYTSGTTGNPKGVLYSHRALVLHSYGIALPDVMNLTARDSVMPLVPMFHVNAWGTPYALPMVGARLVLPGARMSRRSGWQCSAGSKRTARQSRNSNASAWEVLHVPCLSSMHFGNGMPLQFSTPGE